ncbi:MAG: cell division protein FtsI, partial [Propionibacterium sp.]
MGVGAFLTKKRRWPLHSSSKRIQAALVACTLVLTVLMGRAVQLQAIDAPATAAEAAKKMRRSVPLPAVRGAISDRNGNLMAATEAAVDVVADPYAITTLGLPPERLSEGQKEKGRRAPAAIAQIVVAHLGGDEEALTRQLSDSKKRFVVLRRQVPKFVYSEMQDDLRNGDLFGVYSINHPKRIYPAGSVAANVVGFVTPDESKDGLQTSKGAAGLEYALDKHLAGEPGRQTYETSPQGRIPLGDSVLTPAKDGASVKLTLDSDLNWQTEKILQAATKREGASSGMALVMNVKNGEVLALANYPSFDPNSFDKVPQKHLGNRVITDAYEPGSVQKVVTMAALADSGLVNPDTKVSVPPSLMSGGKPIRDAFSHGTIRLTARGIIANSSNIGTAKLARKLDKKKMTEYLSSFGLGRPTGFGLPGEASGSIPKP